MWVFTKQGHISIGQHAGDSDLLVVHAQLREEIDPFVAILDEVDGQKHEVQPPFDGDYKFAVIAQRSVVAEAVATMVAAIIYDKLAHSVHFDFGAKPGFLLRVTRTGLQVATVRD